MVFIDMFGNPFDDQVTPTLRPDDGPPKCWSCERELCETLDAYWGKDLLMGRMCAECRTKREREDAALFSGAVKP